jgi:hypothetical protein
MPNALFGQTWKADINRSLFTGTLAPTFETRLYEERPNGYKLTVSGELNGKPYQWHYEAYQDGKKYPVYGRDDVDAIEIYRLNESMTVGFFSKEFLPGGPYKRTLSADGKSLQVEAAGRDAAGRPYFNVIEYKL